MQTNGSVLEPQTSKWPYRLFMRKSVQLDSSHNPRYQNIIPGTAHEYFDCSRFSSSFYECKKGNYSIVGKRYRSNSITSACPSQYHDHYLKKEFNRYAFTLKQKLQHSPKNNPGVLTPTSIFHY